MWPRWSLISVTRCRSFGDGDWVLSSNAPPGWEQPDFFDGDIVVDNFENAAPYIGLGAIDGEQNAWAFTGNAWPTPSISGSQNGFLRRYRTTFFRCTYAARDGGLGACFPPFTLERDYSIS